MFCTSVARPTRLTLTPLISSHKHQSREHNSAVQIASILLHTKEATLVSSPCTVHQKRSLTACPSPFAQIGGLRETSQRTDR